MVKHVAFATLVVYCLIRFYRYFTIKLYTSYSEQLNDNKETRGNQLSQMIRTYIDIPEIIIANEEMLLEHKEETSTCEVSDVEKDKLVNVRLLLLKFK